MIAFFDLTLPDAGLITAGAQGLEPQQTDPESAVLPLHHAPERAIPNLSVPSPNVKMSPQRTKFAALMRKGTAGCLAG